jgi:hypothetical protein
MHKGRRKGTEGAHNAPHGWTNAVLFLIPLIILALMLVQFCSLLYYEFQLYTHDTVLYWTVGRGILNGIAPYTGLYEPKPPGIFFISALSFLLTDTPVLTSILNGMSFILMVFVPLVFLLKSGKANFDFRNLSNIMVWLLSVAFGIGSALFVSRAGGRVFVDSICLFFIYIYMLLWADPIQKGKWGHARIFLAAALIMGAIGTKESYLLVILAIAIILSEDTAQLLKNALLPLAAAMAAGAAALFAMGWINPYLLLHVGGIRSTMLVGGTGKIIFGDALRFLEKQAFGWPFALVAGFFVVFFVLHIISEIRSGRKWLFNMARLLLPIYLMYLSVSAVGMHDPHHFSSLAPIYASFFAIAITKVSFPKKSILISLLLVLLLAYILSFSFDSHARDLLTHREGERLAKADAEYIDMVLDSRGIETYFYIGLNDGRFFPKVYAFTSHSPEGPLFNQDVRWIELPGFRQEFFEDLSRAELIVYDIQTKHLTDLDNHRISAEIRHNFTMQPWEGIPSRESPRYIFFFRR